MLPAYLYVFASMFCSSQARQDFRQYLGSAGKASSLNLRLSPPIPEAMAAPAVPASWSKRGQGVKCNLCQAEKAAEDMQESGRCRECGPLRSRVLRLFTANNTHRDEFLSLTQDAKKKFYEENRDKFGQDLKIAIASIVKQSTEHVQCASLVGNGTFLDEADMRDSTKPSQAGQTRSSPTRGISSAPSPRSHCMRTCNTSARGKKQPSDATPKSRS